LRPKTEENQPPLGDAKARVRKHFPSLSFSIFPSLSLESDVSEYSVVVSVCLTGLGKTVLGSTPLFNTSSTGFLQLRNQLIYICVEVQQQKN
jgi:hypothetical protein